MKVLNSASRWVTIIPRLLFCIDYEPKECCINYARVVIIIATYICVYGLQASEYSPCLFNRELSSYHATIIIIRLIDNWQRWSCTIVYRY